MMIEEEIRTAFIVIYFLYIAGMSAAAITVPEKVDSKWGWVSLGGVLGLTLILLVINAVLRYRRRPRRTMSIYGEPLYDPNRGQYDDIV
jgi:uncharacterized BrkB/YihY/UPF0761 family membrane protein